MIRQMARSASMLERLLWCQEKFWHRILMLIMAPAVIDEHMILTSIAIYPESRMFSFPQKASERVE